jgi:hypothetical protein
VNVYVAVYIDRHDGPLVAGVYASAADGAEALAAVAGKRLTLDKWLCANDMDGDMAGYCIEAKIGQRIEWHGVA